MYPNIYSDTFLSQIESEQNIYPKSEYKERLKSQLDTQRSKIVDCALANSYQWISMSASDNDDDNNSFDTIDKAEICDYCGHKGGSITCSDPSCDSIYHYPCAVNLDWDFDTMGPFCCPMHRNQGKIDNEPICRTSMQLLHPTPSHVEDSNSHTIPSEPCNTLEKITSCLDDDELDLTKAREYELSFQGRPNEMTESRLIRVTRQSLKDLWNLQLTIDLMLTGKYQILVSSCNSSNPLNGLHDGDIIKAINGIKVGNPQMNSMNKVFATLSRQTDIMFEVERVI
jgi:hypothetical protein